VNVVLVIFDMDGTLVNSSITIANAINYVRKQLGFEPMSVEKILKNVNNPALNPASFFYHTSTFDKDHERWFSEYYTKHHEEELVLYDGVEVLLKRLKSEGKKLAIATNAYRQSTIETLSHLNILSYFDAIACYDDVPKGKPSPDMLLKILDTLKIEKEKAIFVGDGERDALASKNAGIAYLMVDWGFSEYTSAISSVKSLEEILLKA